MNCIIIIICSILYTIRNLKVESIFKLKIAGLVHKIQFQKRKHLLLSMIWYNFGAT